MLKWRQGSWVGSRPSYSPQGQRFKSQSYLFELLTDDKYHFGSSQCTLTCLYCEQTLSWTSWLHSAHGNKYPWTMDSQHASTMNYGPMEICHSSEERLLHQVDKSGTSDNVIGIRYEWIWLSIADITVV
jgi:hypothetical protein